MEALVGQKGKIKRKNKKKNKTLEDDDPCRYMKIKFESHTFYYYVQDMLYREQKKAWRQRKNG